MRLWHFKLLNDLPIMQLRGQWRECCLIAKALHDGNLNHILVNRGFKADLGKFVPYLEDTSCDFGVIVPYESIFDGWHNDRYLRQCLYNLEEKAMAGGIPADEWQHIVKEWGDLYELWGGTDE